MDTPTGRHSSLRAVARGKGVRGSSIHPGVTRRRRRRNTDRSARGHTAVRRRRASVIRKTAVDDGVVEARRVREREGQRRRAAEDSPQTGAWVGSRRRLVSGAVAIDAEIRPTDRARRRAGRASASRLWRRAVCLSPLDPANLCVVFFFFFFWRLSTARCVRFPQRTEKKMVSKDVTRPRLRSASADAARHARRRRHEH